MNDPDEPISALEKQYAAWSERLALRAASPEFREMEIRNEAARAAHGIPTAATPPESPLPPINTEGLPLC